MPTKNAPKLAFMCKLCCLIMPNGRNNNQSACHIPERKGAMKRKRVREREGIRTREREKNLIKLLKQRGKPQTVR